MAARPRAARQPRERKNRPKSGVEGDAKNAKSPYEQRTEWNQHPSSSVEGVKRALDESMSLKKGSSGVIKRHQLSLAESRAAVFPWPSNASLEWLPNNSTASP